MANHEPLPHGEFIRGFDGVRRAFAPSRSAFMTNFIMKRSLKIRRLLTVAVALSGIFIALPAAGDSFASNPGWEKNPASIVVDSLILPYSFKLSAESPRFFPEKDSGAKVKLVVNTRVPIPSSRIAARATVIDAGAAAVFGPAAFQDDGFNTYSFRWGGKDNHLRYVPEGPYQINVEVRCDSSLVVMKYPVQALYENGGAGDPSGCGKGFYLAFLVPMIVRMGQKRTRKRHPVP
jgi:hypothetical protein